jgi:hypothetical protein
VFAGLPVTKRGVLCDVTDTENLSSFSRIPSSEIDILSNISFTEGEIVISLFRIPV